MAMNRFLALAALCLVLPSVATAQEGSPAPVVSQSATPPVRVRLETWEAPALLVSKKLDEVLSAADLANLREQCLGGAEGVSLVTSSVINTSTPAKVTAESITERIYPTEYEPPVLPTTIGSTPPPPAKVAMPPDWREVVNDALQKTTPTSFETRNTGTTVEIEATRVSENQKTWDLVIAVEDVRLAGRDHFGVEVMNIEMPVFTSFRTKAGLHLKEGEWQILSVLEPPRGMEGKPSDKRWVTLVRLDVVK